MKKTGIIILSIITLAAGCATTPIKETNVRTITMQEKAADTIQIDGVTYKVTEIKDEVKPGDIDYDVEVQFEEGLSEASAAEIIKKYQGEIVYTILDRRLYMVKYDDDETSNSNESGLQKDPTVTYYGINPFKGNDVIYAGKRLRVKFKEGVSEAEREATAKKYASKIVSKDKNGYCGLEITGEQTVPVTVNMFRKDDSVISAEPEYLGELQEKPDDEYYKEQWYLEQASNIDIDMGEAWAIAESTKVIKIAVIDSGLDISNKEFTSVTVSPGDNDIYGHGTNVAGIVGANTNNKKGISGICWNGRKMTAELIPIKVTDGRYVKTADVIEGLARAVEAGAEIINISIVLNNSDLLKVAIENALGKGIIIIASAGNRGLEITENNREYHRVYPGAYEGVINVGAYDREGRRRKDSNYGEGIEIYAPGEEIYTTALNNDYRYAGGTSMSAAIVTGIAALMKSENPQLTSEQIKTILKDTSKNGMVNAYQALLKVKGMTEYSVAVKENVPEKKRAVAAGITKSTNAETEEYIPEVIIEGKWGSGAGEFGLGQGLGLEGGDIIPEELVLDNIGNIYVADTYNNRIQKFDQTGKCIEIYPLELFILPTPDEVDEAYETWKKSFGGEPLRKVLADGLAWLNSQLYVHQRRMSNFRVKKYDEKVLVLKSDKFVEATDKEIRFYKNAKSYSIVDSKKNRYGKNKSVWQKYNKNGKKIFEFETSRISGQGKGWWRSHSAICFGRDGNDFYEMKVFAIDENQLPFQPDKGGMQIIKWSLKK